MRQKHYTLTLALDAVAANIVVPKPCTMLPVLC